MEISRPFIRLPYAFDAERMAQEVATIDASAWMQHPSRLSGNSAVALVSRDGGDNDDFDGSMLPTRHLEHCPYLHQVIASFDEVVGRSRLMKLAAGEEVATHVDFNYHWYTRVRMHVPVITNPDVTFYCGKEKLHMRAGECWIFNSWRRHRVTNESRDDRVHLVIDTAGSSRFWAMVRKMEAMPVTENLGMAATGVSRFEYQHDLKPDLRTERFNSAPVMAPGELDALVGDIVTDFSANDENDPQLADQYRAMLFDFAKDWRELWHLYGYRREGWPHYQRLLDETQDKLHPDRRALVTASNNLGVNPVIVQRILKSALATEQYARFIE